MRRNRLSALYDDEKKTSCGFINYYLKKKVQTSWWQARILDTNSVVFEIVHRHLYYYSVSEYIVHYGFLERIRFHINRKSNDNKKLLDKKTEIYKKCQTGSNVDSIVFLLNMLLSRICSGIVVLSNKKQGLHTNYWFSIFSYPKNQEKNYRHPNWLPIFWKTDIRVVPTKSNTIFTFSYHTLYNIIIHH